ncbi:ABC transporter permease [Actinotalea sp. M2MS4P-6]|uniref:ABC transporter permease n=1 Tax=Actinotalea sp. M2MS4P-6 TaxID=2983762 RepID=UPI0021E39CD5|nr:ABC transporter permease [Actinotalea sp. M2MS4P-6]MCV2396041.1 ABC transporter permease [Actinotalea sp. M2MS4P-6]
MTRVALRSIRSHLGRFVMSIVAVLLGVAFVSGTFALRTMMAGTFDDIVATSAQADVYVRGTEIASQTGGGSMGVGGNRTLVPLALADELAQVDGVSAVTPDVTGPIILVGSDGTAVLAAGGAPSFGLGYDPQDPTTTIAAGRAPTSPGEIALETSTLEASGLAIGDPTQVLLGGALTDVTVVGEVHFDAAIAGAIFVMLDLQTATQAWAADGLVPDIGVFAADGTDTDRLLADVQAVAGGDTEAISGADLRAETTAQIREMLGFVGTFLLVFAGIALFVGAFIIANTFQMTVRQRQREFAMLRAVGASPSQVFGSILVQALVVGVVGAAGGIAAGVGLVAVLRMVLGSFGMELSGAIPLDGFTVGVSIAIGALVSLVAAAIPARHAALTPPVEAMREEDVRHEGGAARWSGALGAVLTVGGAAAVVLAATDRLGDGNELGLAAGAIAALIGVLLLAPALVPGGLGALAWPAAATMRPLGGLARGNVTRNPRRTASTAGALMIGMALVGAAAVIASSTQASVRSVVETESTSDYLLRSATYDVPSGAVDAVAALDDVDQVLTVEVAMLAVDGSVHDVVGVDRALFERALDVPVVSGDLAALDRGEAVARVSAAEENDWQVGDRIALEGSTGSQTVTLGAIVDTQAIDTTLMVPQGVLDELSSPAEQTINTAFVMLTDGADAATARDDLTAAVQPFLIVSVMDNDEFADALSAQVDQVLVILYALLGLSVVIAVLGIVNTLALSIAERTREIGLLRAVGLGRLQLASVVTIESVLTSVFGTLLGVGLGVGLASALPSVYADSGFTDLVIPWAQLGTFVGLAVVVGVLAAIWPAVRAARMDVLDAVSYE